MAMLNNQRVFLVESEPDCCWINQSNFTLYLQMDGISQPAHERRILQHINDMKLTIS